MGREGEWETSGALMKYNNLPPPSQLSPAALSFIAAGGILVPAKTHCSNRPSILLCVCVLMLYIFLDSTSSCASDCIFFQCATCWYVINQFCRQVDSLPESLPPGCSLWNLQLCQRDTTPISHLFKLFFTFLHHVRAGSVGCVLLHVWGRPAYPLHGMVVKCLVSSSSTCVTELLYSWLFKNLFHVWCILLHFSGLRLKSCDKLLAF